MASIRRGLEFSFTEPYFMDRRIAAGFDLFSKETDNTRYSYYENTTTGGTLRMGLPITDESTVLLALLAVPDQAHHPEHVQAAV